MRAIVRGLTTGIALLTLGACGDSATSPRQLAPRAVSAPSFDIAATGATLGVSETDFVVGAQGGSFSIAGVYTVNFPANSVCDPSRSTYGATEWDNDCTVLDDGQTVAIHATVSLSSGVLAVDFTPALRFSPSTQVTIYTDLFASMIKGNKEFLGNHPDALNPLTLFYTPTLGGSAVKDFKADKSVKTHVDLNTGRVWRRVKHFSGYSVVTGESCEPSPDNPDCVAIDDPTKG